MIREARELVADVVERLGARLIIAAQRVRPVEEDAVDEVELPLASDPIRRTALSYDDHPTVPDARPLKGSVEERLARAGARW